MNGVINFLKPTGMSSNTAVLAVRRILGVKKAGHTGTLDPGAAGVLAVCVGKTTKLSDFLMCSPKEYVAEIAFGQKTDTQDSYGRVTEISEAKVTFEQFQSALPTFTGCIEQITPRYSAAKQNGQALYRLALKGKPIEEKKRQVTVRELEALSETGENRFLFRVACGKGTYVRTLCEDIGTHLGVPAHMSMLIRTKTSGFSIEQSFTLDELKALAVQGRIEDAIVPPDEVLKVFPALTVPDEHFTRLYNGNDVPLSDEERLEGACRVYCAGKFVGAGEATGGSVRITTLLTGV